MEKSKTGVTESARGLVGGCRKRCQEKEMEVLN